MYRFMIICRTCGIKLNPSVVIYDKIAKQNYCPHCGWPTKEDHSQAQQKIPSLGYGCVLYLSLLKSSFLRHLLQLK